MPLTSAPQPHLQSESFDGPGIHRALNRRQLVRRLFALPGVTRYGFVAGCDQALLLAAVAPQAWPECLGEGLIELESPAAVGRTLLLALPLAWSRGLVGPAAAPSLQALLEMGATPVRLEAWPAPNADPPEHVLPASALALLLAPYRALLATAEPLALPQALELLQLERQLRRQLAPACWPAPQPLGRLLPLKRWLAEPPAEPAALQRLADQLVALLHLLPAAEQPATAEALEPLLLKGLDSADPLPWVRLLEALVGGINSRQDPLVAVAGRLRRAGLQRAAALDDTGERGLALMRLLQAPLAEEQPDWLLALASAIDGQVTVIGAAAAAGEKEQKRALQRQLEAIVQAGATNLPLLQALLPALEPESCYRLPTLVPPSACLVLVKGVLLLGDAVIARLDRPERRALLALLERGLPRLWWQADLLVKLLHDLRRFPLRTAWLQADNAELLPALVRLHSRGVAPPPPTTAPSRCSCGPWRRRSCPGSRKTPAGCCACSSPCCCGWCAVKRSAAPCCGWPAGPARRRCCGCWMATTRRPGAGGGGWACPAGRWVWPGWRRSGPACWSCRVLLPATGGVQVVFAACLALWRQQLPPPKQRPTLPITVLFTCHRPRLALLRQALNQWPCRAWRWWRCWWWTTARQSPRAALPWRRCWSRPPPSWICRCGCCVSPPTRASTPAAIWRSSRWRETPWRFTTTTTSPIPCGWSCSGRRCSRGRRRCMGGTCAWMRPAAPPVRWRWGPLLRGWHHDPAAAASHGPGAGWLLPGSPRGDVDFRRRLELRYGAAKVVRLQAPLYLMRGSAATVSSAYEYGCSLGLPSWRRLMRQGLLP